MANLVEVPPHLNNWTPTDRFLDLNSQLQALGFFVFWVEKSGSGLTVVNVLAEDGNELIRARKERGAAALVEEIRKEIDQSINRIELVRQYADDLIGRSTTDFHEESAGEYGCIIKRLLDLINEAVEGGRVYEAVHLAVDLGIFAERAWWKFSFEKDATQGARFRQAQVKGIAASAKEQRERGKKSRRASIEAAEALVRQRRDARYWTNAHCTRNWQSKT
jgi:hypothetical protein